VGDVFFPDYVIGQLATFGGVSARPMFGGAGLFKGGVMFGLIAEGELYFKIGDTNRADFEAQKSEPFTYVAATRTVVMSYWFVPEDIVENPEELSAWAAKAHAAALKSRQDELSRPKARRRGPTPPQRRRR